MNILLITQVYVDAQTMRSSSVCHFFAKEWVKLGHSVQVIYCYPVYMRILHKVASFMPHYIAQYTNGTITKYQKACVSYIKDGVNIHKIPLYKPIPKIRYSRSCINNMIKDIVRYNEEQNFSPDIILGHFDNPILEIAGLLKKRYKVLTSFVLHGSANEIKRLYGNRSKEIIDNIDVWGFRSKAIQADFEMNFGKKNKTFICQSGIPDSFLRVKNLSELEKIKGAFVYVGALVKRKYPIHIIQALYPFIKEGKPYDLSFVGEGGQSRKIKSYLNKYRLDSHVKLYGQLPREKVQNILSQSEYFVMISRHETFGLVYLEAMANGCITIASRDEGFDGIIQHGYNGFLCRAGDKDELQSLIRKIENLSEEQKRQISLNAISTAQEMTDEIMAQKYLNNVLNMR